MFECYRLATVLNANRIVFIEKGEVVEEGTHEELLELKGRYYQLVLQNEPSIAPSGNEGSSQKREWNLKKLPSSLLIYAPVLSFLSFEVIAAFKPKIHRFVQK